MLKKLDFKYKYILSFILLLAFMAILGELLHKSHGKKIYANSIPNRNDTISSPGYQPQNLSLTSSGNNAQVVNLNKGLIEFNINYSGVSNISVNILNHNRDPVASVVDHKGPYKRNKMVYVPETGEYILDVRCEGHWSITSY